MMSDSRPASIRRPVALAAALSLALPLLAQAQTHSFAFSVNATSNAGAVNRLVLGTNLEWFNYGDSVLSGEGAHRPEVISRIAERQPPVLRYWAGDLFEWYLSLPGTQTTQTNAMPDGVSRQLTYFGTRQMREFAQAVGATPLITLNIYQGWEGLGNYGAGSDAWPAQHASDWLAWINGDAATPSTLAPYAPLGKVKYWELGNEPYLIQPGAVERSITPERFATRAGQAASALRATDAGAVTLLPMSLGVRNGRAASAYWYDTNGQPATYAYMDRVMPLIPNGSLDAVALHDAYMPVAGAGRVDGAANGDNQRCPSEYYWAAMAAPATVVKDIDATLTRLGTNYAAKFRTAPKAAVTEYAPVFAFSLGSISAKTNAQCSGQPALGNLSQDVSKWGATPAGGLYAAELVRRLGEHSGVMLATHWSAHGNDAPDGNNRFGSTISGPPNWGNVIARPIHQVLSLWNQAMPAGAKRLTLTHTTRTTVATPSIGYAEAQTAMPVLEATATRSADGKTMWLLVINKDPVRAGSGTVTVTNGSLLSASSQTLSAGTAALLKDDGTTAFTLSSGTPAFTAKKVTLNLPAGSVSLVRLGM